MPTISFQSIRFEHDTKDPSQIRLVFMKIYEMRIAKADLEQIGSFQIKDGTLDFPDTDQKTLDKRFAPLLDNAFNDLRCILTNRKAVYIHQYSGIPLMGSMSFGIVDRGTNIIELKPNTGCNLDCTFCSVYEGASSKKGTDFVVEADYLVEETGNLIEFKQKNAEQGTDIKPDIFINPHGEPLLYTDIVDLVRGLRILPVKDISIITNGVLLTKKLADGLIDAGLTQLNLSLNALDPDLAKELSGNPGYSIEHIKDICAYISKKIKLTIAPVWIKGINDDEIPEIIRFAESIKAKVGIQNYLVHRRGRKIADQVPWEEFFGQLEQWEKETGTSLKIEDHTLTKTPAMPKPFKKGDKLTADIVCPGRTHNEAIAAARGRNITIVNCERTSGRIKLRILKDKDNIFMAEPL
ncbi:radical SAM protein, partial [Candidatus Woesearchaeota archaeon]|nr:radical SAM protein [Candidatus Woesearchaeota archaeon]